MTEVQKIIRRHFNPRNKRLNWETCGNAIEALIRQKEDKVKERNLAFPVEYKICKKVRERIEQEYAQYFCIGEGYDWINGNDELKDLLI